MAATLYAPIRLNDTVPQKTGLYVPFDVAKDDAIDLVVYFHGHILALCQTDETPFLESGIEYYWQTPLFRCLREAFIATGKRAILIAPTLLPNFGSRSTPAKFGGLNVAERFDVLVDGALAHLRTARVVSPSARVRRIVLAGHSAGGLPMQLILAAKNRYGANIVECWGFECLYFDTPEWDTWLAASSSHTFRHFRRADEFAAPSKKLAVHPNFRDVATAHDHCSIVQQYWGTVLAATAILPDVESIPSLVRAAKRRQSSRKPRATPARAVIKRAQRSK